MNGFYWLASYPKSGNTWLRIFLQSLIAGGKEVNLNALDLVSSVGSREHFDRILDIASSDLTDDEIARARPAQYKIESLEARHPLIRKVHDVWGLTPAGESLFPSELTLGAVYIVRDPRDVAVSYAHHMSWTVDRTIAFMANPSAVIAMSKRRIALQLPQHLSSWSRHVESWLDAPVRLLLIKYEDMLADPVVRFGEVARFLGIDSTPVAIEAAVNATRFDRLRAVEDKNGFTECMSGADRFFRRGVAGGWRDTLSSEQVVRIEADHRSMMRKLGYL
jgi:aryl sulfotransferase